MKHLLMNSSPAATVTAFCGVELQSVGTKSSSNVIPLRLIVWMPKVPAPDDFPVLKSDISCKSNPESYSVSVD